MTGPAERRVTKSIDHVFRATSFTMPATIAVALCTAPVLDASTGSLTGLELSGANAYVRVVPSPQAGGVGTATWQSTNGTTSGASSGTNGTTSNAQSITFPTATADWGTITYVALCDASTTQTGNLLFYGALAANKVVLSGDTFQFNSTSLSIQIDN